MSAHEDDNTEVFTTEHVRERFYTAARELATSKESRHKRVEVAAHILNAFGDTDTGRLPQECGDFDRLRKLYANKEKITPYTAKKLAEEIFDFYVKTHGGI